MSDELEIKYDKQEDTLTIEGIKYSGEVFRNLGFWMPVGMKFMLVKRDNGVVTIQRLQEEKDD